MASVGEGIRSGGAKGLPRSLAQLILNIDAEIAAAGGGGAAQYIKLEEFTASGVDGGDSVATTYTKRVLNRITQDETGAVTLVAGAFTLPAGEYEVEAWQAQVAPGNCKCKIQNTSDATVAINGTTVNEAGALRSAEPVAVGKITIAGEKTFELQYFNEFPNVGDGLGNSVGAGDEEIYAYVVLRKVA